MLPRQAERPDHRTDERLQPRDHSTTRRQDIAGFTGEHDFLAAMMKGPSEQRLALALRVDVRRIKEVDPGVKRREEQIQEFRRIALEDATNASAAETEFRHVQLGKTETTHSHVELRTGFHHRDPRFTLHA
jgi:hypothetical protein